MIPRFSEYFETASDLVDLKEGSLQGQRTVTTRPNCVCQRCPDIGNLIESQPPRSWNGGSTFINLRPSVGAIPDPVRQSVPS